MVKLDVSLLRFMEDEDFRVLTALEMTMRNHDVAPTALVERIAQLPHGGCRKRLRNLLKHKMIFHENTAYDGYAMKYGAYDYLALRTLCKRGTCVSVGHRIGCGKESDIILVRDEAGHDCVLKLQRLGRCSFRSVTRNRDYKGNGRTRHGESWFYLSRLASQKEYAFMRLLYDEGFPVPKPIDQNRHALVMELVPGTLLNNITALGDAAKVYRRCLDLMIRLAEVGLIHGDFNEFNLMITDDQRVIVIDFPQMVSTNHRNAAELFDRDVHNLASFFQRRFHVETLWYPTLEHDVVRSGNLDQRIFASGYFTVKHQDELEQLMKAAITQSEYNDDDDDDDDGDDETASADGPTMTPIPREAAAANEEQQEGLDERDDASSAVDETAGVDDDSGRASTATDEMLAEQEARRCERNANFLPDGQINAEHLKNQVRRDLRRKDNHQFNRTLHRNTQKGRHKAKIQRQIKGAFSTDFFS